MKKDPEKGPVIGPEEGPEVESKGIKCLNCGNVISQDINFCPYCGEKTKKEEYVSLKIPLKVPLEKAWEKEKKEAIERERINKMIREIFNHLCYLKKEANDMIVKGVEENDMEKAKRALAELRLIENAKNNFLQGVWGNKDLLRLVGREPTKKIKESKEKLSEAPIEEHPKIIEAIHEEEKKQGEWYEMLTTLELSREEINKALSEKEEKRERVKTKEKPENKEEFKKAQQEAEKAFEKPEGLTDEEREKRLELFKTLKTVPTYIQAKIPFRATYRGYTETCKGPSQGEPYKEWRLNEYKENWERLPGSRSLPSTELLIQTGILRDERDKPTGKNYLIVKYSTDILKAKYRDTRGTSTMLKFALTEDKAKEIFSTLKKSPRSFEELFKVVDPELLTVCPPIECSKSLFREEKKGIFSSEEVPIEKKEKKEEGE